MVTSSRTASRLMIIAKPNCSASWRGNLLVLLVLAIPSLGAGIGFAMLGAWPVLPLAGLEMLALGSALYYVNWKLQYRHVITLSDDSVCIDKGFYTPRQSWKFPRHATGLAIVPERHPWEGPGLSLQGTGESVSIGEFLNRDDSLELAALLRREIRVGSYSACGDRLF
ncbi:MAG: DUF2244 domain-containing protein [Pseudomonadales bacterium]|nr:DUF2244 domain-containing protein [Halioglobus sp.]MCP5131382.1 DUF2244 domain-containing protein [Pseudomonadales bacterium]